MTVFVGLKTEAGAGSAMFPSLLKSFVHYLLTRKDAAS